MPLELTEGAIVAGRYRLDYLLGEGGMGAVWAATNVVTRKHVALKFLKTAAAERPDTVRRFLREARAASAVNHPTVVQIHDVLQLDDGLPMMIMDPTENTAPPPEVSKNTMSERISSSRDPGQVWSRLSSFTG